MEEAGRRGVDMFGWCRLGGEPPRQWSRPLHGDEGARTAMDKGGFRLKWKPGYGGDKRVARWIWTERT